MESFLPSSTRTCAPRSGSVRRWRSRSGRSSCSCSTSSGGRARRASPPRHRRARRDRRAAALLAIQPAGRPVALQRHARERRVRDLLQVAVPRRRRAHGRDRRAGRDFPPERIGQFFALLMAIVLGMFMMASATDLLMVYMSIELVSMVSYVLAGFRKGDRKAAEGSLKYVIYGGVASGVMIFGMSYLFGLTGTTSLLELGARIQAIGAGSLGRRDAGRARRRHRLRHRRGRLQGRRGAVAHVVPGRVRGRAHAVHGVPLRAEGRLRARHPDLPLRARRPSSPATGFARRSPGSPGQRSSASSPRSR